MKIKKNSVTKVFLVPAAILFLLLYMLAPYSVGKAQQPAAAPDLGAFQSDDFNRCSLNETLWTFIDPLNDASGFSIDGTRISIYVPEGVEHHVWGTGPVDFSNDTARIMQPAADVDFEIEVKFESGVSQTYQMQGVLIQQDENDLLRLEFHAYGDSTRIYAGRIINGLGTTLSISNISGLNAAPMWMKIKRVGDQWTQYYSLDGENWQEHISFSHSLTVTSVGVYAGNTKIATDPPESVPEHTAIIDYFFNTASPITPEDGDLNTITVNVSPAGSGSVTRVQDKANYACGEEVKLYPNPNSGWKFTGWSGAVTGTANPGSLLVSGDHTVTANFVMEEYTLAVNQIGSGNVVLTPPLKDKYYYGDKVTLEANPTGGFWFDCWLGDLTSTQNPVEVTITKTMAITARFLNSQSRNKLYLPITKR